MLRLSFAQWSAQTLQEASHGPRAALSQAWRKALENLDTLTDVEDEPCRNAIAAYHAYLQACRGQGLEYLQPSAVLLEADAAGLDIEFCPLPANLIEDCPAVAKAFGDRYRDYVEGYVQPFARAAAACSRQIVLVDVLRVLRQGVHTFNDTRRCLQNVLDVFGYARPVQWYNPLDWGRWLFSNGREIERVAFIATKADQASRHSRPRLKDLLRELVRCKEQDIRLDLNAERLATYFVAAVRCTTDAETEFHGQVLGLLQGRRADKPADATGPWFPGEAPGEWPSEDWNPGERQYRFPDFLPRRLPPRDGATFDHINLDKALWHVLEDLVT